MLRMCTFETTIEPVGEVGVATIVLDIDQSANIAVAHSIAVLQDGLLGDINEIVSRHFTENNVVRCWRNTRRYVFPEVDGKVVYPTNLAEYLAGSDPVWDRDGLEMAPYKT